MFPNQTNVFRDLLNKSNDASIIKINKEINKKFEDAKFFSADIITFRSCNFYPPCNLGTLLFGRSRALKSYGR